MFVCVCHAVTEQNIVDAVSQGANSMKELRLSLKVASQCGKCSQFAKNVLDQTLSNMDFNYDLAVEVKHVA